MLPAAAPAPLPSGGDDDDDDVDDVGGTTNFGVTPACGVDGFLSTSFGTDGDDAVAAGAIAAEHEAVVVPSADEVLAGYRERRKKAKHGGHHRLHIWNDIIKVQQMALCTWHH